MSFSTDFTPATRRATRVESLKIAAFIFVVITEYIDILSGSNGSAARHELEHDDNGGDYQQQMDHPASRVRTAHAERPQD
jgi:hypothetical protein